MVFGSLNIGDLLVVGFLGRLLIFLWNKQPLSKKISKHSKFFRELFECDLCLGVWTYFFLALLFGMDFYGVSYPVIGEFLTGCSLSFAVWLMRMGWDANFRIMVIREEVDE